MKLTQKKPNLFMKFAEHFSNKFFSKPFDYMRRRTELDQSCSEYSHPSCRVDPIANGTKTGTKN